MNILTAPTSLGNRPYEADGTARWTDHGPARLRQQGILARLHGRDLGDVPAAPYRDFVRPPGGIRNEDLILDHVRTIARVLEKQSGFTLILGGDCSVLLGSLLGLSRGRDLGLVYIDGHSDFNTTETTKTGAVAGMDLALATGRGSSELARLRGPHPLVRDEHVVTVGVRDHGGPFREANFPSATTASEVLDHVGGREFFIHLDVDVLDPSFMPFVDSPEPGGLDPEALTAILTPLVRHPNAVGMEMTIYDPRYDHDSRGAATLTEILESAFGVRALSFT
ncbi:MAG TPA: arginase family protein [Thermoanaerobaculia bacterium]|nr:arginase family protein [Thermoanaerobaculia bacterium]